MDERPPKILGLLTKKQLLGLVIAALVIIVFTIVLPFGFLANFTIGIFPALPIIVIFFFPSDAISPVTYIAYYVKELLQGSDTRTHNGNTTYYRKKKAKSEKIKRYRSYKGVR